MNIIPLSSCVLVFSFCLAMAAVKLFQSSKLLSTILSVKQDMRSLFNRLMLYNILQTASVAFSVGNFCNWYMNLKIWKDTALAIVKCEIKKTLMRETAPENYEMCVKVNAHLPKPSGWAYWFFHLCALVSLVGAIIFQCSIRVQQRSLREAKEMMTAVAKTISTSPTETARSQKYEWIETTRSTVNEKEKKQSDPELIFFGNDTLSHFGNDTLSHVTYTHKSTTVLSRLETDTDTTNA